MISARCSRSAHHSVHHPLRPTPLRRSRSRLVSLVPLLALFISACSGGSDPAIVGDSPTSQPKGALRVEPASFTLSEGGSVTLKAMLGSQAVGASQITWSVSPSSSASIDVHGALTAHKHGEVMVTARYSSLQATANGTIRAIPRAIEARSSTSLSGIVGRSASDSLAVRAIASDGTPVPGVQVAFEVVSGSGSVSHAVRATGEDGVVRVEWIMGTTPGQQQVRARSGQLGEVTFGAEVIADYATAKVEIVAGDEQEAPVVTLLPEPLAIKVVDRFDNILPGLGVDWGFTHGGGSNGPSGSPGSTSSILTTTTDNRGMTKVFWMLGTEAGIQRALCMPSTGSGGSSESLNGTGPSAAPPSWAKATGFRAKASPGEADGVEVDPEESSTVTDATHQLSASMVDQYGNVVEGGSFVWTTDQSGVVAVDNAGLAYGLKVGKGEVFAEDSSSKLKGSAWVSVEERVAAALQRSSGNGQKGVVGSQLPNPVAVRVLDQMGSPVVGVSVGWRVVGGEGDAPGSPGSSTTLTNSDGVAATTWTLGTVVGEQTLEASVGAVSPVGFTAEAAAGPVGSVTISTDEVWLVSLEETAKLAAVARDAYGNPVFDVGIDWSTLHSSIASVDEMGMLTAKAVGSALIVASAACCQVADTLEVSVTQVPAAVMTTPSSRTLAEGESYQFVGVVRDAMGYVIPGLEVTWSSEDPSIATVDEAGQVTGQDGGTTQIQSAYGDLAHQSTVTVTETAVVAKPGTVTDLASHGSTEGTITLRWTEVDDGTGNPARYTIRYGSPTISWGEAGSTASYLTGSEVGSVMEFGRNGLDSGTTYEFQLVAYRTGDDGSPVYSDLSNKALGATLSNGGSQPQVASIVASPSSVSFNALGNSMQLTAEVRDSDGALVSNPNLEWVSLNPVVASVDGNGVVVARDWGAAQIVVSDVCCSAADTVQVTVSSPGAVKPWFEETWDYASTADMIAQDHISVYAPSGGETRLVTGLTGTPWGGSKAYERHFYDMPYGIDYPTSYTVSLSLRPTILYNDRGAAEDSNFNREVWFETWVKWDTNWNLRRPEDSHGDDKTFHIMQSPRGSPGTERLRWQIKFGNFGSHITAGAGSNTFVAQKDPVKWNPPADHIWNWLWDGDWHLIRWHLKMSSDLGVEDGIYQLTIDDIDFFHSTNIDTGSPATDFFNVFKLGANASVRESASMYYGPVRIFTSDPGWPAGTTAVGR